MAYFVMVDDEPENEIGEALFVIHNCFKVPGISSWRGGRLISKSIDDPIYIDFEPVNAKHFRDPPVDLWDLCIPLMSTRLGDALKEIGVDNLQLFPAMLINMKTKEVFEYYAFNVVGLVSAADINRSQMESYDGSFIADTSFTTLHIDETRTKNLLMLRLSENINALIVHEIVRDYAVSKGIPKERFVKPKEWAQL